LSIIDLEIVFVLDQIQLSVWASLISLTEVASILLSSADS
jgi:hypothetical protein